MQSRSDLEYYVLQSERKLYEKKQIPLKNKIVVAASGALRGYYYEYFYSDRGELNLCRKDVSSKIIIL